MSTLSREIEKTDFERMVRDALANLYDPAALATHPLIALLPDQAGTAQSKGEHLRNVLLDVIDRLQPAAGSEQPCSPVWRPHLVLRGRYVDGRSLPELEERLSVSERQLRREHSRAIRAVAAILWDSLFATEGTRPAASAPKERVGDFPVNLRPLDVMEVLSSLVDTLQRRVESEGTEIRLVATPGEQRGVSDRVILRQVLVGLLSLALDLREEGPVTVWLQPGAEQLHVRVQVDAQQPLLHTLETDPTLQRVEYWCERIGASLAQSDRDGLLQEMVLSLPTAAEPFLLVVDDQEPAIRLFQRYLSQTGLRIVGLRDGGQVLRMARRLQPQAITLDIMMPHIDGWEVLQSLQADPLTRSIPVIVCSVWEEPDLAMSLGASDFLSKPIRREDLLDALRRLNLLDSEGEATAAVERA